jgi:hypothetical protein
MVGGWAIRESVSFIEWKSRGMPYYDNLSAMERKAVKSLFSTIRKVLILRTKEPYLGWITENQI